MVAAPTRGVEAVGDEMAGVEVAGDEAVADEVVAGWRFILNRLAKGIERKGSESWQLMPIAHIM